MIFGMTMLEQGFYGVLILLTIAGFYGRLAFKRVAEYAKSNPEARDRAMEKGWNLLKEHIRRRNGW